MDPAETLRAQTTLPLIVAPMFLISTPDMALEACRQGVIGSFPALNERTSAGFESWLVRMNGELEKMRQADPQAVIAPYAVNLIVHPTNTRLEADLDLCVKHKVPVVITSLGAVPDVVKKVHSYGGIVLHDVTNVVHAKKAAQAGVDGLIAVCAGAGGHGGTLNPVVLTAEIRKFFPGILILAGGLSSGRDILAAQALGADFAYMGTRFINTKEAAADPGHKQMICDAVSADIVYTAGITGVPANFLRQSLEKAGLDVEKLRRQGALDPSKLKSIDGEKKAWKNIWSAGQGVGVIDDVPSLAGLVARMRQEYALALADVFRRAAAPLPSAASGPKTPPPAPRGP